MKSRFGRSLVWPKVLVLLHLILGAGGIFGGTALLMDPSGTLISLPSELLERSPFPDFLIPGVILLLLFGTAPVITAYGIVTERRWYPAEKVNVFRHMHWAWNWSLFLGAALIVWIAVQVVISREVVAVQGLFIGMGIAIQVITLLPPVRERFHLLKNKNASGPFHRKSS